MINRVADKDQAKRYLAENGNQSGMVGMEILYRVISSITVAALAGFIAVVAGYGIGISTIFTFLLLPIGLVLAYAVGVIIGILGNVIATPFNVGRSRYYLALKKNGIRSSASSIFETFDFFVQFAYVEAVRELSVLWLPLVIEVGAGIVGGIIIVATQSWGGIVFGLVVIAAGMIAGFVVTIRRNLMYWPVPMIQADHPQLTAQQVLERSREMTKGHLMDLFVFELSFIGWHFLSGLTGGLVGLLYSIPYENMTSAILYEELKGRAISLDGIKSNIDPYGMTIGIDPNGGALTGGYPGTIYDPVYTPKANSIPVTPPAPQNDAAKPTIEGVAGMYAGSSFPLKADQVVVLGRDAASAQIVFNQGAEKISRRHCSVMFDSRTQMYIVVDYSSNGTYVKGSRLQANVPVSLARGTEIALGNNSNVVRLV